MDPLLSEQQSLLRDSAVKLAAAHGGAKRARSLRNAGEEIDREAWGHVIEAGWLGTMVGDAHGGLDLGALDLALTIEETGKQLLMVPLTEAAAAAWALSYASAGRAAPALLQQSLSGAGLLVAATSPHAWSFAAPEPGAIDNVTAAGAADAFLLDCSEASNGGVLHLVSRDALDLSMRRNIDGSASGRLTAPKLGADTILVRGEEARRLAAGMQQLMVLWTSAELLGVAQAALDITNDYLKLRRQFGKPIGSFQGLQHRMVDCFVDLELSRSLLYRVLAAWGEGTCHSAMVSACKARLSRGALVTVRTALQLHGAIGYTDEHDIGLYYKRAVTLAARYGNEIMHVDAFSAQTLPAAGQRG